MIKTGILSDAEYDQMGRVSAKGAFVSEDCDYDRDLNPKRDVEIEQLNLSITRASLAHAEKDAEIDRLRQSLAFELMFRVQADKFQKIAKEHEDTIAYLVSALKSIIADGIDTSTDGGMQFIKDAIARGTQLTCRARLSLSDARIEHEQSFKNQKKRGVTDEVQKRE